MAFQFPPSPVVDQTFTPVAGVTYRWSGTAWHLIAGPGSFITQADADLRYLQPVQADALYVNVNEVPNIQNRIINGKMAIDQRNAGAAVTVGGSGSLVYSLDRWAGYGDGTGRFALQRLPDTPTPGAFMLRAHVTVAQAALGTNVFIMQQAIEGYNVADLNFGGVSAAPFTVAFDVWSPTVTGPFSLAFRGGGGRSYVTTFNVDTAATRTVVITVPGDTAGTWNKTNGSGIEVVFGLGVGSASVASSANTWLAGNFVTVAGCVNMMATVGNLLYIGNVRLYKGSVDYGPDQRLYAEEFALCQRYYCKTFQPNVVPANNAGAFNSMYATGFTTGNIEPSFMWVFPVQMRAIPTVTLYNAISGTPGQWSDGTISSANARAVLISEVRALIDNNSTLLSPGKWSISATASAEL